MTNTTGQHIGYIRVSSYEQNSQRQLEGVECHSTYTDKTSGKSLARPELTKCLEYIRGGDTLHIHSIDRLARNLQDLLHIITALNEKGITVMFHKENMAFNPQSSDPFQKLQLQILGSVAEFERSMIRERQREGIAIAKQKGIYKGRKPSLSPEQVKTIQDRIRSGDKVAHIAKDFGVSRQTIYEAIKKG